MDRKTPEGTPPSPFTVVEMVQPPGSYNPLLHDVFSSAPDAFAMVDTAEPTPPAAGVIGLHAARTDPRPSRLSVNAKPWTPPTGWRPPPNEPPPRVSYRDSSVTSLQGPSISVRAPPPPEWCSLFDVSGEAIMAPVPFVAEPATEIEGSNPHFGVSHPRNRPDVTLLLYYYVCLYCPLRTFIGKMGDRPADVKLGGVCGDVQAACIAHLVEVISGIGIAAIDVFCNNYGRCNLWLHNPADTDALILKLDKRVWMSPSCHGYAVVVDGDDSREYLLWYLDSLREHGPKRVRFPRHLVTCERWIR